MSKNKKNKTFSGDTIFALSVVGVSILLLSIIVFFGKEDDVELTVDPINISTENQVTIGNPDAPVEVVQFFDFQCQYCQEWDTSMFDDLNNRYIETGDVKYTLINFPFLGKPSEEAALMFETVYGIAGAQEAIDFKRNVFSSIESLGDKSTQAFYKKNLLDSAEKSVTAEQFKQVVESFDNKDFAPALEIDDSIAKNANVLGTPAVYVDNVFIENPFDPEALYNEIEKNLE